VEEFYVLTWESPKEMIFEMPVRTPASVQFRFFGFDRFDSNRVESGLTPSPIERASAIAPRATRSNFARLAREEAEPSRSLRV
jgi:hypothetical protein